MKTSKLLITSLLAAAAMSAVPAWAEDVALTNGVQTALTPSSGVAGAGNTYTYTAPEEGTTDNGGWLWLGNRGGTPNVALGSSVSNMALSGSGLVVLGYQGGNGDVVYNFDFTNTDAVAFSGKFAVVNQWDNDTVAKLSGTGWSNVEYVFAGVSREQNWVTKRGYGNSSRGGDTLALQGATTLAGITGTSKGYVPTGTGVAAGIGNVNLRESITVATSGTVLTLSGAGTYEFYGSVGTESARVGVSMTGTGAQTLGGTTYLDNLSVTGGTLVLSGTANIAGTTTVGADGSLDLSGGTITLANAIQNSGTVTVSGTTVFNFTDSLKSGDVYTLIAGSGMIAGVDWNTLTNLNFTYNGAAIAARGLASSEEGVVSYNASAATAKTLTWNGDGSAVWKAVTITETPTAKPWLDGDTAEAFYNGDSVKFSGDAAVTVDSAGVTAGTVNITAETVTFSGGTITALNGVSATGTLGVDGTLKSSAAVSAAQLSGSGTIDLGSTGTLTLSNATKFNNWTGTVRITDKTQDGLSLADYGTSVSTVELSGFRGYLSEQNNGSFAGNLKLTNSATSDRDYAAKITNGWRSGTFTFSGALSGDGLFWHSGDPTQTYKFTGDVSAFTGTLKSTTATFKFAGTEDQTFSGTIIGDGTTGAKVVKEGSTALTLDNTNTKIGNLQISAGTLNLNAGEAILSVATNSLSGGTLNIGKAATVKVSISDAVKWDGTTSIDVAGVLALNSGVRISLGANNSLSLSGGTISGTGDQHGALDFFGAHTISVTENSEISAVIRPRSGSLKFNVADQKTLTVSGAVRYSPEATSDNGTIEKLGDGILNFTNTVAVNTITQSAGTTNFNGTTTLGGATLTGGKLAVAAGANVSVSGTVEMRTATLDGGTAGITAGTLKFGYGGGVNTATIQGKVNVTGNLQESSGSNSGVVNGETISLAEGASLSVGGTFGTTSPNADDMYQHSYVVNVGAGASFSAGTIAHGDALTVNIGGGNAAVSATTLVLNSFWASKTHAFTGQGADVSTLSVGTINLNNKLNKTTTFLVSNARLEVGAGGITGSSSTPVSLSGVTLGVRDGADSWSSDLSMTLAGTMGADVGADKSISLGGNLSGTIETLTKTGAGTLTLSGRNTYSGATTIEGGVLVAGHANALGAGNVTVADGATLERGLASGSVAIDGTLTTEGAAILSTGALSEDTAAFAVTGNVTLSAGTIFDVGALANGQVVSSAGTLTVSGKLSEANFLLNGSVLGDRTHFEVSTTGNAVTISNLSHDVYTLTWVKYEGPAVWSNGCSGWSYQASEGSLPSFNETFQAGDSVIFSDGSPLKNVVVDGVVSVGTMTIDSDFAFSGKNGAAIRSSGALTKTGAGTATIDSTVDLSRIGGGIVVAENGGKLVVDTASGYTGAVSADKNGTFTLNVSSDTTLSNTLSGAGTFEKTGAGTLTVSSANEGLTGQFVISEGTVKLGMTGNVFGAAEREAVVVNAGGTLDVNGKAVFYKVELAGGELVNNGSGIDTNTPQLRGMRLSANSSVISKNNFGLISDNRAGNELDLAGHTLTKTGSNMFWLVSTNVTAGVIDVREGALVVMNGNSAEKTFSMAEGALIKINGGELKAGVISDGTYRNVSLGDVAIVLTDANKGTARITGDTNCSFNAGGATLYLDIGALTAATLTPGEEVSLTIAGSNVISGAGFFETVLVGTYGSGNNWINDTEWAYKADSWDAAAGTLLLISVPEPSVFGLLAGAGALALAGTRRRRKKA